MVVSVGDKSQGENRWKIRAAAEGVSLTFGPGCNGLISVICPEDLPQIQIVCSHVTEHLFLLRQIGSP